MFAKDNAIRSFFVVFKSCRVISALWKLHACSQLAWRQVGKNARLCNRDKPATTLTSFCLQTVNSILLLFFGYCELLRFENFTCIHLWTSEKKKRKKKSRRNWTFRAISITKMSTLVAFFTCGVASSRPVGSEIFVERWPRVSFWMNRVTCASCPAIAS